MYSDRAAFVVDRYQHWVTGQSLLLLARSTKEVLVSLIRCIITEVQERLHETTEVRGTVHRHNVEMNPDLVNIRQEDDTAAVLGVEAEAVTEVVLREDIGAVATVH
jgi:hypothetical protein